MSATSSNAAHEGVPVALPDLLYNRVVDRILDRGSFACSLMGSLQFVPKILIDAYPRNYARLYLLVDEVTPEPSGAPFESDLTASISVTFEWTLPPHRRSVSLFVMERVAVVGAEVRIMRPRSSNFGRLSLTAFGRRPPG